MVGFLEENHFHLILDNLDFYLNRFESYNQKIIDKINETYGACPMELVDVFCFWDAKTQRVCKPSRNQRLMYNGKKKYHCYKVSSMYFPDGMHGYLSDFHPGRWNDNKQRRVCGIVNDLAMLQVNEPRQYICLTDKGYGAVNGFWPMYHGNVLNNHQSDVNRRATTIRTCVEWGFGDIIQTWAFIDFYRPQKSLLSPIGNYFHAATLMTNIRTCLYGNQTSEYYGIQPPTLEQYI